MGKRDRASKEPEERLESYADISQPSGQEHSDRKDTVRCSVAIRSCLAMDMIFIIPPLERAVQCLAGQDSRPTKRIVRRLDDQVRKSGSRFAAKYV